MNFESSRQPVARRLKILIYGAPKVGKTWFAIHTPDPLIIDTESSTDAYRGRADLPPFTVAKTASPLEVTPLLEELHKTGAVRNGSARLHPQTLVIDSYSVLWQVRQEAGQRMAEERARTKKQDAEKARVAFGDWSLIKRPIQRHYTLLINMPLHVVITAREKALYDDNTDQPKVIGQQPDIERNAAYIFDIILRLSVEYGQHVATVEGSRYSSLPVGMRLVNPTWEPFEALTMAGEAPGQMPDPDVAAEAEATLPPAPWTRNSAYRRAFLKHLEDQGLSEADANAALGMPWQETPLDRAEVKARIGAWLEEQLGQSPPAKPVGALNNGATVLATETVSEATQATAADPEPSAVETP